MVLSDHQSHCIYQEEGVRRSLVNMQRGSYVSLVAILLSINAAVEDQLHHSPLKSTQFMVEGFPVPGNRLDLLVAEFLMRKLSYIASYLLFFHPVILQLLFIAFSFMSVDCTCRWPASFGANKAYLLDISATKNLEGCLMKREAILRIKGNSPSFEVQNSSE